jgi:hypothetical protein
MDQRVELIAAACHQAWYAYTVLALGEEGKTWQEAPEWQRSSIRHAVKFWDELDVAHTSFETLCAATHVAWMNHKLRDGWKLGPVKDEAKKEHPCLVPYEQLPLAQRKKDEVVLRAYLALRGILGNPSFA